MRRRTPVLVLVVGSLACSVFLQDKGATRCNEEDTPPSCGADGVTLSICQGGFLDQVTCQSCATSDANGDPTLARCAQCGDGFLDTGEVCDDGNALSGDGCRGDCLAIDFCGNGVVDVAQGEVCDPAAADGANCRADCLGNLCDNINIPCCGNGFADEGEACDDGNTVSGDGCAFNCLSTEACGNGVVEPDEICDGDPNCQTTCIPASCGDGQIDAGELCLPPSIVLPVGGLPVSLSAAGLTAADTFNRLFVARKADDSVDIWDLRGSLLAPLFNVPIDAVGNAPLSVFAGQFDASGNTSIVTANELALGNAEITFISQNTPNNFLPTGLDIVPNGQKRVSRVIGVDLDRNGVVDAVTNDRVARSIVFGQGASFATSLIVCQGNQQPEALAAGGLDGGLFEELLVLCVDSTGASELVLIDNLSTAGTITLGTQLRFPLSAGSFASDIEVQDINGDGRRDVLIAERGLRQLSLFLNETVANGAFVLADPVTILLDIAPNALTVADFNQDGLLDAAAVGVGAVDLEILLNDAVSGLRVSASFAAGRAAVDVLAADLNGDNVPDVAVANASDDGLISEVDILFSLP